MYAAVTGYYSYIYGTDGIESTENDVLCGDSPDLFTTKLAGLLTGRNPRGGSVDLTLNKAAQQAAYKALQLPNGTYRPGAVVALDPTTGAILAPVSTPSYDPTALSSHNSRTDHARLELLPRARHDAAGRGVDGEVQRPGRGRDQGARAERQEQGLQRRPGRPDVVLRQEPNAARPAAQPRLHQTYPPGSLFKVIVSAAALKPGINPDTKIAAPQYYWPLAADAQERLRDQRHGAVHPELHLPNGVREQCKNGTAPRRWTSRSRSPATPRSRRWRSSKIGAAQTRRRGQGVRPRHRRRCQVPLKVVPSTIGNAGRAGQRRRRARADRLRPAQRRRSRRCRRR